MVSLFSSFSISQFHLIPLASSSSSNRLISHFIYFTKIARNSDGLIFQDAFPSSSNPKLKAKPRRNSSPSPQIQNPIQPLKTHLFPKWKEHYTAEVSEDRALADSVAEISDLFGEVIM
jgi:hypothetical protein